MALIGPAISEKMFENNGSVHVYRSVAGADNPLGQILFIYSIIQST